MYINYIIIGRIDIYLIYGGVVENENAEYFVDANR